MPKNHLQTLKIMWRRFEDLLYAEDKDWDQISSMIDVDSFVAFYLLEEFSENPDSCRTSLYMYQDGPNDVLHMGPVWDFDKALGYAQKKKYGGDPKEIMSARSRNTWEQRKTVPGIWSL